MENIPEVAKALPAELSQATLNPEQYAAHVIEPFQIALEEAIAKDVRDYDVTTTAGMKVATTRRAVFRDICTSTEKERAARKAPLIEIGRQLDAKAKELIALASPHKDYHDALIKAEEARKAAEKAEKERIERELIARIHEHIAEINAIPSKCVGKSAEFICGELFNAQVLEIEIERFGDFTGTAMQARQNVEARLQEMLTAQQAHEAEQARIKAEREELARQQAEQRRIEAEAAAERRAQEEADQARREAEAAAHRQRMAAEEEARRKELAAQQAEFERQQELARAEKAEFARQQEEFRQQQEAARLAAEAKAAEQEPAPVPETVAEPVIANVHELKQAKLVEDKPKRPSDMAIISTLAMHYRVHEFTVVEWLTALDLKRVSSQLSEEFA